MQKNKQTKNILRPFTCFSMPTSRALADRLNGFHPALSPFDTQDSNRVNLVAFCNLRVSTSRFITEYPVKANDLSNLGIIAFSV